MFYIIIGASIIIVILLCKIRNQHIQIQRWKSIVIMCVRYILKQQEINQQRREELLGQLGALYGKIKEKNKILLN